jgi:hypothetical protein
VAQGVEVVLLGVREDVRDPPEPEHVPAQRLEDIPDDLGDALHDAPLDVVAAVVVAPLDEGHGAEVGGRVRAGQRRSPRSLTWGFVQERMTGIEPAL